MITSASSSRSQTHVAENLHFLSPGPLTARHSSQAHTCHFTLKRPFPLPAPPTGKIAVAHTRTWSLGHGSRIVEKRQTFTLFDTFENIHLFFFISSHIDTISSLSRDDGVKSDFARLFSAHDDDDTS